MLSYRLLVAIDGASMIYRAQAPSQQPGTASPPSTSILSGPHGGKKTAARKKGNRASKQNDSFKVAGFDRLVEFGSVGRPMTAGAIWNSYVSVKSSVNRRASRSAGKRTSGFCFLYRPPLVRNWLSFYGKVLDADDITPLANPPRAANSGIYLPRIPGLPRLDFHAEGGYTDADTSASHNGNFVYRDIYYHDLSTNKGNLIGSWMGRESKGYQAWTSYHFSARDSLQFGFRHANVYRDFIRAGEAITDGYANVSWRPAGNVNVSGGLQYAFQVVFCPHWS